MSIRIASFGPVGLRKGSKSYGYITTTPKPGWRNVADVVGYLASTPIAFETDVNAPAMAEMAQIVYDPTDPPTVVYITVGTGIGVGAVVGGAPISRRRTLLQIVQELHTLADDNDVWEKAGYYLGHYA